MSNVSENIAWQLAELREDNGTKIVWNGVTYSVASQSVSSAAVGADKLDSSAVGAYFASTDPRVFVLSAILFVPSTNVCPPMEGAIFHWHGLKYHVTKVTYGDSDEDTHSLYCYAYREIV